MNIHELMTVERTKKKQTQAEAAKLVGASLNAWGRWERGEGCPGLASVVRIAEWSGHSVEAVALAFVGGG